MARDNSPKTFASNGKVPQNGDIAKWDETLGGWVAVTTGDIFAAATTIGIYTLPEEDGSDGDVLTTDGSGVLSWTTPA